MKKTFYRIIRFEYEDDAAMEAQLRKSVAKGVYALNDHIIMTVADRTNDPCEEDFFRNRVPDQRIRRSVITAEQFNALPESKMMDLYL
jgi:hypothetical protein